MIKPTIVGALATLALASPEAHAQSADRITAELVMRELRDLGHTATAVEDASGDPNVRTSVDGHAWRVYFYDCEKGAKTEARECRSYQFYAGYDKTVPFKELNEWLKGNRYLKAYADGKRTQTEIDILRPGPAGGQGAVFRAHYNMMKSQSEKFREYIKLR